MPWRSPPNLGWRCRIIGHDTLLRPQHCDHTSVGRHVDSPSETRDHCDSASAENIAEIARACPAMGCGMACAHDAHTRRGQRSEISHREHDRRSTRIVRESLRIVGVSENVHPHRLAARVRSPTSTGSLPLSVVGSLPDVPQTTSGKVGRCRSEQCLERTLRGIGSR